MKRAITAAFTLVVSVLSLVAAALGYLVAGGATAVLEVAHPGALQDPVPACSGGLGAELAALLALDVCGELQGRAKVLLLVGLACLGGLALARGRVGAAFGNAAYLLGAVVVLAGALQGIASTEALVGTSSVWYNTTIWMDVIEWTLWTTAASALMLLARWGADTPEPVRHLPGANRPQGEDE